MYVLDKRQLFVTWETKMRLQLKRVYELPAKSDGIRILVDRLWPRGLSKAEAGIDFWAKDVAPTNELRHWYQHEQEKWPEFQRKYVTELQNNPEAVQELIAKIRNENATLLFSSKETSLNNAVVLKEYLETLL
jgi:uncharacterized protein YeaO (DUF488 family)